MVLEGLRVLDHAYFLARGKSYEIAKAFLLERDEVAQQREAFLLAHGGPNAVPFGTEERLHGFALPKGSRSVPRLAWRFTHRLHERQSTFLVFQPDLRNQAGINLHGVLNKLVLPGPKVLTGRMSATAVEEEGRDGIKPNWIMAERMGRQIVLWVPIPAHTDTWRDNGCNHAGVPFHPSDAERLTYDGYAEVKQRGLAGVL